jgi:hypothetical protein
MADPDPNSFSMPLRYFEMLRQLQGDDAAPQQATVHVDPAAQGVAADKLRALLRRPPAAPDVALPKQGPLDWFMKAATLASGALGINEPKPEDFQTPEDLQQAKNYYAPTGLTAGREALTAAEDAPTIISGFHGTRTHPDLVTDFGGVHIGTRNAALERLNSTPGMRIGGRPGGETLYPVELSTNRIHGPLSEHDMQVLTSIEKDKLAELAKTHDAISYVNEVEDPGSLSYLILNKGRAAFGAPEDVSHIFRGGGFTPDAPMPIKAFHGSPYDFDKFSSAKIGTGEGGQAYSYGHYLAERSPVAGSYKFSNKPDPHLVNPTGEIPDEVKQALDTVGRLGFDTHGQALQAVRSDPLEWRQTWDVSHPSDAQAADLIDQYVKQYPGGRLYETQIHASPEQFLDWDKPLSQQSPHVQAAINKMMTEDSHLKRVMDHYTFTPEEMQQAPGKFLYELLAESKGGRVGHTEGGASQLLNDAGVVGTKYLDQGSRRNVLPVELSSAITAAGGNVEQGVDAYLAQRNYGDPARVAAYRKSWIEEASRPQTHNLVVYPGSEHLIEIVKKYGVTLPVAAEIYRRQQAQQQGPAQQSSSPFQLSQ